MANVVGARWLRSHLQMLLKAAGELLGSAYRTSTDVNDCINVGSSPIRRSARLVHVQMHHQATREYPPGQVGIGEVEYNVPSGLFGAG